jgi:transcriptional regulator with XRE-family HTH domain
MGNSYRMRRRSTLTPQEQEECKRLKAVWETWRSRHGHNQQWLADQLGMNQSAVSHYLNGRNAVNAALLVKIKKVLGVEPAEISPRVAAELAPVTGRSAATFGVLSAPEQQLVDYIHAHGKTEAQRASIARQILLAARAFLEKPVEDAVIRMRP